MSQTPCPSHQELSGLLEGQLASDSSHALTDHVGACVGCQAKLENLACDNSRFSDVVRHIDKDQPPSNSAYWRALHAVEAEGVRTALFTSKALLPQTPNGVHVDTDGHPSGELKLDFLQLPEVAGDLGKLGEFRVLRVIGRGGMGVVLHGYDPCLQRDIAIKVLDPQLAGNETARARFCREARAAAAVTHENIVTVHQVDEDEASGLPYLVMQLVNGESLEQRLKRVGKLTVPEVARLGMQAAAGLAAAHAGGLIHRDIKPGNILLEEGTDRVKLTDFGLARAAEDVKLTRTGFVAGTPLYMAPEQARGEDVDARADLFSLGTVLYEAAAGKPPFDGKTPLAVLRRVADEAHAPLEEETTDAPVWLSHALDRLLEKDPIHRYQSAAEVAEVFASELARIKTLSPLDVPAEVCGLTRASLSGLRHRRQFYWKCALRRSIPWVGGILIGGTAVGLWEGPSPVPIHPSNAHSEEAGPPPTAVLEGKAGPVWAVTLSPDGQSLAMGIENGMVKVWDLREHAVRKTLSKIGGTVWSVDISPEGDRMVTASDTSAVTIWNLKTYAIEQTVPLPTSTKAAVFSPDGKKVAVGDRGATVWLWDIAEQTPHDMLGHTATVHSVAFSPDGKKLVSGSGDGTVKLWNIEPEQYKLIRSMDEHASPVYGVAFSPDGTKIASAGWDGTVRLWDARNGDQLHIFRGHASDVWSVSFSPDGELLASAGWDGTVKVWDVASKQERFTLRDGGVPFHTVRFAREGRRLVVGCRDGKARVWDLAK